MFYLSNRRLKIQNLLEKIILLLKTISSEKEKYISSGRLIFARAFCASLGWDHDCHLRGAWLVVILVARGLVMEDLVIEDLVMRGLA
jgi:hypothetical protein